MINIRIRLLNLHILFSLIKFLLSITEVMRMNIKIIVIFLNVFTS